MNRVNSREEEVLRGEGQEGKTEEEVEEGKNISTFLMKYVRPRL